MTKIDDNYKLFTTAYSGGNFFFASRIMYQILSEMPGLGHLQKDEWEYKFSELLTFLSKMAYIFDSPDTFYDILATAAIKLKENPYRDWKGILNE